MPAKMSAGDFSVEKASNKFKANFSVPAASWFRRDLLLPSLVILLLITLFFIGFLNYGGRITRFKTGVKTEENILAEAKILNFTQVSERDKFISFLEKGLGSDEQNASDDLISAFRALSFDYVKSPSSQKRLVLEDLAKYFRANFSKETSAAYLDVPCLDQDCGVVVDYSQGLLDIKKVVEENSFLEEGSKQAILQNLQAAAVAAGEGNKVLEFNNLSSVFQELKFQSEKTKNKDIKNVALQVSDLMQKVEPTYYEFGKQKGYLEID